LYLIHQNVGYIAIRELEIRGISPLVAITSSLAVVLALAWGLSLTVEQPAQNWLKRRRQSRLAPAVIMEPTRKSYIIPGGAK
jgi:peptidoglycan/LPS O-acetylase OafA/YrhL